jgi:hypothetical protein
LRPGLTIEDLPGDVTNVTEAEELSKIILVGHSFGAKVLIGCA